LVERGLGDNENPFPRRDAKPAPTDRRCRRRRHLRRITSPQEPAVTTSGYAHTSRRKAKREAAMAKCETCGNDYDKAFQVSMNGTTHTFDSFECAIHALAPTCENCGIRIVGHGLEKDGTFFCCEHCAEVVGVTGLRDRIGAAA
jgi:hypothetical protein